jgi:hypothetical protein
MLHGAVEMQPADDVAAVLKRYLRVEEETLATIASEVEGATELAHVRSAAKQKLLRKLELHSHADELVEQAVARYREDLYILSRRHAEDDVESGIITRAHVRAAQRMLARRRRRYSWGDGMLALGGLGAGAGLPHVIELSRGSSTTPSGLLIAIGLVGMLLLGMGIIDKAKS